jgi:ABC-2 type transport system ATP-binding protein
MPGCAENGPASESGVPPPAYVCVESASKSFGALTAVAPASFRLAKGEILGVLGSDGAGKTTLLRMIAGQLRPSSGAVFIDGCNTVTQRNAVKSRIGYMPQRFGLYQDLTVSENIEFFMDIYGVTGAERIRRRGQYLGFSNLLPFTDRLAGDLSGGMKQKLGLACVLVHEPALLILDEPTNGVDPVSRREFWSILGRMKQNGMTLIVSTAYMDEGQRCDRLLVMHASRILEYATPQDLTATFPDLEAAVVDRIQHTDGDLIHDRFDI